MAASTRSAARPGRFCQEHAGSASGGCSWVEPRPSRARPPEGGGRHGSADGGLGGTNFKTGGWGRGSTESLRASAGQTRDRPAQSSGPLCGLHRPGCAEGRAVLVHWSVVKVRGESDPPRCSTLAHLTFPSQGQKRTTGLSGR